jgi:hypothetical protein
MAKKQAKKIKLPVDKELDSKLINDLASEPKNLKLEDTVKLKAVADVADAANETERTYDKFEKGYVEKNPDIKKTFEDVDKLEGKFSKIPDKEKPLEKQKDELLDDKKTSDEDFDKIVEDGAKKFREQKGVTRNDFSNLFQNRRSKAKFQAP